MAKPKPEAKLVRIEEAGPATKALVEDSAAVIRESRMLDAHGRLDRVEHELRAIYQVAAELGLDRIERIAAGALDHFPES